MHDKFILWDVALKPEDEIYDVYLWDGYNEIANVKSLFKYVDSNGEKLREKYISWIDALGQRKIKNKSVVNYFSIDQHTSVWWLSSLVEKSPWKTPSIMDAIRLIAIEEILIKEGYTNFELVSSNKKLHKAISGLCKRLNVIYKWKKIETGVENIKPIKYLFRKLPYFLQFLTTLIVLTKKNWIFKKSKHPVKESNQKSVFFCSQFAHISSKAAASGQFYSHLWETLPELLIEKGYKLNFIHHYLKSNEAKNSKEANILINKFNSAEIKGNTHSFLFSFLSITLVFQVFKDSLILYLKGLMLFNIRHHFRVDNSNLNLWPIMKENWYSDFCGSNLISNIFWFRLFETALAEIPYQSYGLYLNENQSWERALIYAWNKNKHGHLIAVQHSTVRFWDLRYFVKNSNDPNKEINQIPKPDITAINGKLAKTAYKNFGIKETFFECEAIRYNYLKNVDIRKIKPATKRLEKILILGDYVPEATIRMLKLVEDLASSNSNQYTYTIKPHPNFIVKSSDYPLLNLVVTMQPLVEILNEFDVMFCGNLTSASLDAYLSGSPVIITFDPKTLNFSPLRGNDDVSFVSNTEELRLALENSLTSKTIKPNIDDFFCLNEKLLNWDKLLS